MIIFEGKTGRNRCRETTSETTRPGADPSRIAYLLALTVRRGGRVVLGGGLESRHTSFAANLVYVRKSFSALGAFSFQGFSIWPEGDRAGQVRMVNQSQIGHSRRSSRNDLDHGSGGLSPRARSPDGRRLGFAR